MTSWKFSAVPLVLLRCQHTLDRCSNLLVLIQTANKDDMLVFWSFATIYSFSCNVKHEEPKQKSGHQIKIDQTMVVAAAKADVVPETSNDIRRGRVLRGIWRATRPISRGCWCGRRNGSVHRGRGRQDFLPASSTWVKLR